MPVGEALPLWEEVVLRLRLGQMVEVGLHMVVVGGALQDVVEGALLAGILTPQILVVGGRSQVAPPSTVVIIGTISLRYQIIVVRRIGRIT